jgi:hypothetical protein
MWLSGWVLSWVYAEINSNAYITSGYYYKTENFGVLIEQDK